MSSLRSNWRLPLFLLFVITFLLAAACFRHALLPALARFLNVGTIPRQHDYVFVMPGGELTRPFVASAMVRKGLATKVLVPTAVDGPQVHDGIMPANHELIRKVLVARGVPAERITFLRKQSNSSWSDAEALMKFLKERPTATVAVVTNDYHTRRAQWVMKKVLLENSARIAIIAAPTDEFNATNWWKTEIGMATYIGEFTKLGLYLVRYGDITAWCLLCSAAVLMTVCLIRCYRGRGTVGHTKLYPMSSP